MEEDASNDVEAVEYIDSNDEDEQAGETRPIMLLLRRLIRNKQNTVMTNAQIIDILQSEFDICIKPSHELEVNIYIKIIKRYLKDWPQWEELERISTKLSNVKDYEAITKVLNHKYKNLKEYLGVMLEVAKPLAKKAVEDAEKSMQEGQEVSIPEVKDGEHIAMEVQCSREQLNCLIIRHPELDTKKSIFNLSLAPTHTKLASLTFSDIIKGWPTKIAINLPHFVLNREVMFKYQHVLVNKARTGQRKFKNNTLPTEVQRMANKKTVMVPKELVMQNFDDILTTANKDVFAVLYLILSTMKQELDKMETSFQVPSSYRAFANKYKYVRYLYAEEGVPNSTYDLQLEEMMSPIYKYSIHICRAATENESVPLAEWLKLECGLCSFKAVGDSLLVMKTKFLAHVKDYHTDEPDWQCTKCYRIYGLKYMTMQQWCHNC